MTKDQRQTKILELLSVNEKMNIETLLSNFDISLVTLRRDIKDLQDSGQVISGYGFIQKNSKDHSSSFDHSFLNRLSKNYEDKLTIVKKAISYVKENDVIFIGEGTTCYLFAKLLVKSFKKLNIVTNGLYALNVLAKASEFNIETLGGTLLHDFNSFVGPKAESMIENIYINKYFFSCSALIDNKKTFELSPFVANIKQIVFRRSEKKYLMIDKSKLNKVAPFYSITLDENTTKIIG